MYEVLPGGLDIEKQAIEEKDPRNFDLDILGGFFGYTAKAIRKIVKTLSIKQQYQVNSCVTECTAVQKEPDEGVIQSPGDLGSYLASKGLMNSSGTSIQAALKAEMDRGIAEEKIVPTNHANFTEFSHPRNLTIEGSQNAALHKIKSYWRTTSLDTMFEQADLDRIGQIGMNWYTGFNNLAAPYIIERPIGRFVGGHDVNLVGYDQDYHGRKVVILQTSYGAEWGDNGKFYVPVEAFNQIFITGAYYVLDIDKDKASWLSLNAGKLIIENGGQKVYAIVGDEKRHIKDEAVLLLLGYSFQEIISDTENMLPLLKEGPQLTIADVPLTEMERFKSTLKIMANSELMRRIFAPIFPDVFTQ